MQYDVPADPGPQNFMFSLLQVCERYGDPLHADFGDRDLGDLMIVSRAWCGFLGAWAGRSLVPPVGRLTAFR